MPSAPTNIGPSSSSFSTWAVLPARTAPARPTGRRRAAPARAPASRRPASRRRTRAAAPGRPGNGASWPDEGQIAREKVAHPEDAPPRSEPPRPSPCARPGNRRTGADEGRAVSRSRRPRARTGRQPPGQRVRQRPPQVPPRPADRPRARRVVPPRLWRRTTSLSGCWRTRAQAPFGRAQTLFRCRQFHNQASPTLRARARSPLKRASTASTTEPAGKVDARPGSGAAGS